MNDKYIKLDDAIHVINCTNTFTFSRERTIEKLREVLAADVRPVVRGRWKRADPRSTVVTFRCSECNYYAHIDATNFCPRCGADMRRDETVIS